MWVQEVEVWLLTALLDNVLFDSIILNPFTLQIFFSIKSYFIGAEEMAQPLRTLAAPPG